MKRLFFDTPLYKKRIISDVEEDKINSLEKILKYNGLVDGYNPELNENTSYKVEFTSKYGNNNYSIKDFAGINKCKLKCVRTGFEINYFFLLQEIENDDDDDIYYEFQKIGQYPTIADIEIGKYKKFSKVISKQYLRELNKSIGLATNGVGIGSFVYLRRIFESLIESYHITAKNNDNWDEKEYTRSSIVKKIELLKKYLPGVIVKYKTIYSIISKGIHELKEQECLEYFPIVKDAIIAILEQDYLNRENEEKQKELETNIKSVFSKLK